ncbi:MAG: SRPBCC domain-containing protein [Candidatus Kariarchaeaceae archaeon]|jgi:activator of HSP90 ATPase
MSMTELTHSIQLSASPAEVYNAILSSEKHSGFTGAPAVIDDKEGGSFSTFNGAITGTISKLVDNKLIEMDWRAGAFPEGYFTKVVFQLESKNDGTTVSFTHSGVPAEAAEMINEGWELNYWKKLPAFFSNE